MDKELLELIQSGNKLEAIKVCQKNAGIDFKEAKQYVEEIENSIRNPHAKQPNRLTPQKDTPYEESKKRKLLKHLIGGIVLLIILLKIWSYQIRRNGTIYEYGILTQDILGITDIIIPWPDPYSLDEPNSLTRYEMQNIAEKIITEHKNNASPTQAPLDYKYSDIVVADTPLYWESQILDPENGELLTPEIEDAEITIPEGTTVYVIKDDDQTYDSKDLLYATVSFNGQVGYVKKYFLSIHAGIVNDELSK